MRFLRNLSLPILTLLTIFTSSILADINEITFCKLPYIPTPGSPEDITNCFSIGYYNLGGCYQIPEGYAQKGQSFEVTQGLGECALFWDAGCGSPNPAKAWYGAEAENMGQDFLSFECKCQNRC